MTDLAIIVPSRARPERLREMIWMAATKATLDLEFWVGLDEDDPSDYSVAIDEAFANGVAVYATRRPRMNLVEWTNFLARRALTANDSPPFLASLGDDHRPRTKGWDAKLCYAIERLDGPGFAYGNDLLQGARLPTAWVVSAEIVREVGWMMLPTCSHLFVDNAVKDLGEAAGRIVYRGDVVIEHEHPSAGKAATDQSYAESNSRDRYRADRDAYMAWRAGQMLKDAATLSALTY